ncbi:MAG: hypothetical protein IT464_03595 [Planctomycetes bacterium]|nr:hypothetical protein [Planctomycetota bacterium]
MRRSLLILAGVSALLGAVLTSGCGPGLIALGGGGTGTWFGLSGGDDEKKKKKDPPPPTTNVAPAVIVTGVSRGDSPISVSYTLLDANADPCSVEVQYSTGGAFQPCFAGAGGDGTTGLSSSASGVAHSFSWEFVADFGGPQHTSNVTVRVRANDGTLTGNWNELANLNVGNDAPTISNIQFTNYNGTLLFTFEVADENSDAASFELAYSIDQGQSFVPIDIDPISTGYELIGNPPTNLPTSPGGSAAQVIWNSNIQLLDYVGQMQLLFVPRDHPTGYADPTEGPGIVDGPYLLDNSINNPPVVSIITDLDGQLFVGKVPFQVALSDDEQDPAAVIVQYSIDNGVNWDPATLVNQFQPGVAGPFQTTVNPQVFDVVWDALADMNAPIGTYVNDFSNVLLLVVPADGSAGTPVVSSAFDVRGNTAPLVAGVSVLQDSGNIPIVITLQDSSADPCSLLLEYSTDGNSYTTLPTSSILFGDPDDMPSSSIGFASALVWDSTATFPNQNQATVFLRVTATDHPPSAPPILPAVIGAADLTGVAYVSLAFPVINDPSGTDPVNINIYTTDDQTPPNLTPTPVVTVKPDPTTPGIVYFDREITPSFALMQDTLWKILDSGPAWGTLETIAGGTLVHATGSVELNASVTTNDTIVIHDGLNEPVTFEFWDGGALGVDTVPILIAGMTTAEEFAQALAAAINGNTSVRIVATHQTGTGLINLQHEIACRLGNAGSADPGRGNAVDISSPQAIIASVTQMNGGAGTQRVRYVAPAVDPGKGFVDLICEIDHPSFWQTVRRAYRLYFGDPVGSVSITATNPNGATSVLVNGVVEFTGAVTPTTAPQHLTWEVVGGAVNGTISQTGRYQAPATHPTPNTITIRAFSVDPAIQPGTATLTIIPEPTSISVSAAQTGPLTLGQTRQYSSTVFPLTPAPGAPQNVDWRVVWNGTPWGGGNSNVGTITTSGFYTAPATLPNPPTVIIQAVSQVKPTVIGSYPQDLVAPAPTSFALSPSNVILFAGSAGQQFTPISFVPTNANQSVTWELSASVGTLSNGYYTPPATVPTQTQVTVTARSTADTLVTASALVTINTAASVIPGSITVTPASGLTYSAGVPIQFSHVVGPAGAPQSVQWSKVSGSNGSVSSTGLFTPTATTVDADVTLRCEATGHPTVFQLIDIVVTGDGRNWVDVNSVTMSRGSPNMVWDSFNDRLWMIGGHSPGTTTSAHDRTPLTLDTGPFTLGVGAPIGGITYGGTEPNTIAAAFDSHNKRIIAILGKGVGTQVEVWQADVQQTTPTWTQISYGSGGEAPTLGSGITYHCWFDEVLAEVHLMFNVGIIYRFDCGMVSPTKDQWKTRQFTSSTGNGPAVVELCGHSYDPTTRTHWFVGPANGTGSATMRVSKITSPVWSWSALSNSGGAAIPAIGIANPAVLFHANHLHVYSGKRVDTDAFLNTLYDVNVTSGTNAGWSIVAQGSEERPQPRGDAGFIEMPSNGFLLYGGEVGKGAFGDFWEFTLGQTNPAVFVPLDAENMRPQGRRDAAGVMANGFGYFYGGMCDHGPSADLWRMEWDGSKNSAVWTRLSPAGVRPPPLWGATMTYNPDMDLIFMLGGDRSDSTTPDLISTLYTYNPNSNVWTQVAAPGSSPGARRGAALCYDRDNERIWAFGGEAYSAPSVVKLNDLRYLSLGSGLPGTWTAVSGATGSVPDPRVNATMGWDEVKQRVLVVGGTISSGNTSLLYEYWPVGSATPNHWNSLVVNNGGSAEPIARSGAIWDPDRLRFIHAPATRRLAQAMVMATPGPAFQYLTDPPLGNNGSGSSGLFDDGIQTYYVVFGERNIGGRQVGTNTVRRVEFD